jgi:hypothetical protein
MTLILRRLLASSTYAISGTLAGLAKKLEGIVDEHTQTEDDLNDHLLELVDNFETFDELADDFEGDDADDSDEEEVKVYTAQDISKIKIEIEALKEFAALAKSIQRNSKGENLTTALERGFSELERLQAPKKAIIFTESKRTQEYIKTLLESRGYTDKVVLFNGTNNDAQSQAIYKAWVARYQGTDKVTSSRTADMRAALVDYFRDEATIMVATEAAAEGINLQFCSLVINYDMPWNPQRIEQRIGRCHRYGQKFDVVVVNFLNKANAADQRVYELLNDKFKLFDGVFGASDEVLGSIENGVDFEKRIARIYQECRTTDQIATAFNALQSELEDSISGALQKTRQQLLENFDEEVNEKLRVNLKESQACLSKYENWLWSMTEFYLKTHVTNHVSIHDQQHGFELTHNPFPALPIALGAYRMGKQVDDAHVYRMSHPLAQRIMQDCQSQRLAVAHVLFDYQHTAKKISILEPLVGQSGWLLARSLTLSSFEAEDHVLFAIVMDDGTPFASDLSSQVGSRLFSLSATVQSLQGASLTDRIQAQLDSAIAAQRAVLVNAASERNGVYFEQELEKLDHWGEDRRSSLKINLKDLDEQIKELKKQARGAANLPDKLKLEKLRKKQESEHDQAWRDYDQAAKEIELAKDRLIERIEAQLDQTCTEQPLFSVRFSLV